MRAVNSMQARASGRPLTLLTVAAVLVLIGVALAAATSGRSEDGSRPQPLPAGAGGPTPALLEGASEDRDGALRRLEAGAPAAATALRGMLAADVEGTLRAARVRSELCDALVERGVTECVRRGLPPGTQLELATLDRGEAFYADVSIVRAALAQMLVRRQPTLELLATASDGSVLAIVGVAAAPAYDIPGGISEGPLRITRLQAVFEAGGTLLGLAQVADSTPPLEVIRYDEYNAGLKYTVLFASAAFKGAEQAFADRLAAESKAAP